jgi:hypothetical protein
MSAARRFPPPWFVDETDACFIIRDGNRQAVAYVYCEDEPGTARGPFRKGESCYCTRAARAAKRRGRLMPKFPDFYPDEFDLRAARMNTAADLVERSVSETLTYYAFPDIHWQKIRTNNPLRLRSTYGDALLRPPRSDAFPYPLTTSNVSTLHQVITKT